MRAKPLLLAIDDDEFFRKTLDVVIAGLGMLVRTVGTVDEFTQAIAEDNPDILLVDLQIGDVNGLDLVCELRRNGVKQPLLVVSGTRDSATTASALELGASDYILKPFDKILLANKLAQFANTPELEDQSKLLKNLDGKGVAAKIIFDGSITEVDELGIKFVTSHLVPKAAVVRLGGEFVRELGGAEECLVCVTQTGLNGRTGLYEIYAEFEGVDVEFLQNVRKWITGKKSASAA